MLESINSPADLRRLSYAELDQLAAEIREFIVEAVNSGSAGGHVGSMTGGMAFEGLNNLGHSGRKAIIILNDNGRSYAPTISKLTESVARLRLSPTYLRQRARIDK